MDVTGYRTFRQVAFTGSFEGQTLIGLGVPALGGAGAVRPPSQRISRRSRATRSAAVRLSTPSFS